MPLTLDTPQQATATIDTLEINSFSVDMEAMALHIVYDEGHMDSGVFVPDHRDKIHTLVGPDMVNAIAAVNGIIAGQVTPDVYAALKEQMYNELIAATGLIGTVA